MTLPADISRCDGRTLPTDSNPHEAHFLAPECRYCLRKTADRLDRVMVMAAPAPMMTACVMRIKDAHD